jgi:hypothetical protein
MYSNFRFVFIEDIPTLFVVLTAITMGHYTHNRMQSMKLEKLEVSKYGVGLPTEISFKLPLSVIKWSFSSTSVMRLCPQMGPLYQPRITDKRTENYWNENWKG